jgi:hypothetical protein
MNLYTRVRSPRINRELIAVCLTVAPQMRVRYAEAEQCNCKEGDRSYRLLIDRRIKRSFARNVMRIGSFPEQGGEHVTWRTIRRFVRPVGPTHH